MSSSPYFPFDNRPANRYYKNKRRPTISNFIPSRRDTTPIHYYLFTMKTFFPFRLAASFADGSRLLFDGLTESAARSAMEAAQATHGDITWWDAVTDENYICGRYYKTMPDPPEIIIITEDDL